MGLGIDPKNDYAFKCLFGSEQHTPILIHLLNAVLEPPPNQRVVSVQLLNPIVEPVKLDDKLAILDLKAREQSGRQFHVEMQMALHPALKNRFLYHWARTYGSQLVAGESYELLMPAVSIYFLDALLFPETDAYHLPFQLHDPATNLVFCKDLAIHLFQLPNFVKKREELRTELDCWLYFLNNGEGFTPDELPFPLRDPEFQEAAEIMQTLTLEEIERHRYESREKARRDALSWQKWQEQMEREQEVAKLAKEEKALAEQEKARAEQEKERADQMARTSLISQIGLCERILGRPFTPKENLGELSLDALQSRASHLESELPS